MRLLGGRSPFSQAIFDVNHANPMGGDSAPAAVRARSPNPLLGESCGRPVRVHSPGRRRPPPQVAHAADAFMMPSERADPHAVWRKDSEHTAAPRFAHRSMAFTIESQFPEPVGALPRSPHTAPPPSPFPSP